MQKKIIILLIIIAAYSSCNNASVKTDEFYSYAPDHGQHPVTFAGFFSKDIVYFVGASGAVFFSRDRGENWYPGSVVTACLVSMDIISPDTAWASGHGADLCFTTDGGKTWQLPNDYGPVSLGYHSFLSFIDGKTGWRAAPQFLCSTTDGGNSWKELILPAQDTKIAAIHLRTSQEGYLLDDFNGCLYVTTDGGSSWKKKDIGVTAAKSKALSSPTAVVRFKNSNEGLIIMDDFTPDRAWIVLKTADGGASWSMSSLNIDKGFLYLSRDNKLVTITDFLGKIKAYSVEDLL